MTYLIHVFETNLIFVSNSLSSLFAHHHEVSFLSYSNDPYSIIGVTVFDTRVTSYRLAGIDVYYNADHDSFKRLKVDKFNFNQCLFVFQK